MRKSKNYKYHLLTCKNKFGLKYIEIEVTI